MFERPQGKSFFQSNPISFIMIILISVAYLLQQTNLGNTMRNYGALQGHLVWELGEWWRMVSVMFLHGSFMHYLFNTFFGIYVISAALERIVGPIKFAALFLGGGLIASLTVVVWDLVMENFIFTIGASGAIFAALGALLWLILNKQEWFNPQDASSIKAFVLINVVFTFIGGNISIPGHIGGLIGGYLLATIIPINRMGGFNKRASMFNDPYSNPYIDPASIDEVDVIDDDEDDDDPFKDYYA